MAFAKKKKKIFKIRRKNIIWTEKPLEVPVNKSLSISEFIWSSVLNSDTLKKNLNAAMVFNYSEILNIESSKKQLIYNNSNEILMHYYSNYCSKYLLHNTFVDKIPNNDFVVVSIPKAQMFFTLNKTKTLLVFTCGVIRVVMHLLEKCSKKRKIVILNSIKFMWRSAQINFDGKYKLIFKKNYMFIKSIFQKNLKEAKDVSYILYYPRLNFGYNDFKKRGAVKKKIKKTKKYITE